MVAITSVGAYIPMYRLNLEEIAKMWCIKSDSGDKAVAGYDEDSITTAVAAVLECMSRNDGKVNGLYFTTTTAPYKEKRG